MKNIVSGLERSGTSLLMQILQAGGVPVAYDKSREPDVSNPKGYFELEGGKIINKLMNKTFNFSEYEGKYIKVTAFGLKYLMDYECSIIFSTRNMNEILDSMHKMSKKKFNKEETKELMNKLLENVMRLIKNNEKWNTLIVNYNNFIDNPKEELLKIKEFIGDFNVEEAMKVIDSSLYRNRRR